MNEVQRLAYLNAMDVISYIPRVNLPGAKPSMLCDLTDCAVLLDMAPALTANISQEHKVGKESLTQLQSGLATNKVATAVPVSAAVQVPTKNNIVKDAAQINVRFHWVIFQPVQELLILLPAAHQENSCMQLLKNILSAIDIKYSAIAPLENFVWPPALPASVNLAPVSNSLGDARETVQALLEGYQLKQQRLQQPLRNILVFDDNLGRTLFNDMIIPELPIRILPSLQVMSVSSPEKIAEAKRITWQKLKDLKKI